MTEDEARTFSAKQRKNAASSGAAMPDGSFPIQNAQDLKNAIKAVGRASNSAAAKAHIIKRAKAMKMTNLLPSGWTSDKASFDGGRISCPEEDCERSFLTEDAFFEHADAVHTFNDIQMIVSEAIREKYGNRSDNYQTNIYTYVIDIADDWVVFEASQGSETDFYKCSYTILDNVAQLGSIVEVHRRTVWDPAGDNEPDGVLSTSTSGN